MITPSRRPAFGRTLLVGAVLCMAAGTFRVARAQEPELNPPQYLHHDVPPGATPQQIYLRDCAYCHGSSGEGSARGPSLRGVGKASVDFFLSTGRMPLASPRADINRGKPPYPPAMIAGLVDYVAGFGPGGTDVPAVDLAGADLGKGLITYTEQCAPCHVWSGVGGELLYREAPPVNRSTATEIAEAVRVGPGNMPAFGKAAVPEEDLNNLVAYVRTLHNPEDRGGNPLWHIGPLAEGGVAWLAGFGLLLLGLAWVGERG